MKKYQDQLNKMDDYIEIGPRKPKLARRKKSTNSHMEKRKGFYPQSENAYD